jgi:hypothetical protein
LCKFGLAGRPAARPPNQVHELLDRPLDLEAAGFAPKIIF